MRKLICLNIWFSITLRSFLFCIIKWNELNTSRLEYVEDQDRDVHDEEEEKGKELKGEEEKNNVKKKKKVKI